MQFTQETESPDAYHFWTGVSLLSAATKRQVYLEFNQFRIYPNTYIILVGPAGARKSVATSIGIRIADKVGLKRFSDKITGAALIKDLSESQEKLIDIKKGEITFVTPIIIYSSELGVFMGADAYGSGVIADLTDLFDCPNKWEKKTISRDSEIVIAPYVTLLAASTPQTLKDVLPPGAVGQGFTSRILFVWAPSRRKRVPIPTWGIEYEALANSLVADLKHISSLRGVFQFSDTGLRLYRQHYMEHPEPEDEFEDERLRNYAARKDIHMLKVAQILSVADRDDLIITEVEIKGAIDALNWLDQGLPSVFAGHGGATTSEDVVRIFRQVDLSTNRIGFITYAELVKRNYYNLNHMDLNGVLSTLIDGGGIEEVIVPDKASGKMIKVFRCIDATFIQKSKINMPRNIRGDN
jgi:hypothetical protein